MNEGSIAPKDEPATTAKVIMSTTSGEIDIEIWAKEAPLAARNFIQLSLEGYYDNTIFHRMIPGFMIQGGDPTGTGTGGQSIYGSPFKDQFHQRLKFGRRGMVAMANSGKDTNNSQFFITFAECPHLNKKHTIFGKVVGNSIYNFLTFQSLDTNEQDRPVYPPSIRKMKVILNPFDDIIPRNLQPKQQIKQQSKVDQKKEKKNEIKKLKNKNKLTFEQEEGNEVEAYKVKSSHDTLNDERLSKKVAVTHEELEKKKREKEQEQQRKRQLAKKLNEAREGNPEKEEISGIVKADMLKKKRQAQQNGEAAVEDEVLNYQKRVNPETGKMQIVWEDQQPEKQDDEEGKMRNLRQLQQRQYEALRADQLNFKKMKEGSAKERRKQLVAQETTLLSNVQKRKYQFLKKNMVQKREQEVLSKLNRFTERLKANNPNDWMCHNLKFHIDSHNAYNLDKKNQQRKGQQEEDDGGLKVDYGRYEEQEEEMDADIMNLLGPTSKPGSESRQ